MNYVGRDFADRKDRDTPANTRSVDWRYLLTGALALPIAGFSMGLIYGNNQRPEKTVDWYLANKPGMNVAQCSAMENDGIPFDNYLDMVKEKNPGIEKTGYQVKNITLPDTDGDGKVCGKKVD